MNVPPHFFESIGQALAEPESMGSLRILADRQLAKGTSRETLTVWFELARERFPAHEDRLLEVLDLIGVVRIRDSRSQSIAKSAVRVRCRCCPVRDRAVPSKQGMTADSL